MNPVTFNIVTHTVFVILLSYLLVYLTFESMRLCSSPYRTLEASQFRFPAMLQPIETPVFIFRA
jgi:hypothetical protein